MIKILWALMLSFMAAVLVLHWGMHRDGAAWGFLGAEAITAILLIISTARKGAR